MPDPQPSPLPAAGQLATSLDALAAVAAHLRIQTEGIEVEPEVRALLADIARDALGDTGPVPAESARAIVALTRAFLHQASDLVEHPDRSPGWDDPDERLLQSIGQISAGIAGAIQTAAARHPPLHDLLHTDGSVVVDVGTGTGWLAIALATSFPAIRVVGLDIFPTALELAGRNVVRLGLTDRIQLRLLDAVELEPGSADVVWLPMPFLPRAIVPRVMAAAVAALRPGGWLLPGTFPGPGDTLPERLMTLRTIRSGGHPWTAEELCTEMAGHGLADVGEITRTWPVPARLYAGRVPTP